MKHYLAAFAGAVAMCSISTPASAQGCSRELLQGIADDWVEALEKGSMFTMNLGEWVDYNENFKRGSLGGFLDGEREVPWHLALLDTTQCKVFVEAVMPGEGKPLVAATQIGNGFFGVGPFLNITSRPGDWLFDADRTLYYASRENWADLPEGERASREELIAAADAYLDLFNDKSVEVPWGTPCARLEGGIYTGRGQPDDTCDIGVPDGVELKDRRYVVDEAKGAVNVILSFGENGLPDSHTFRVQGGKLRYIHTVTNCLGEENCGFPPLEEMLANNPGMQPDLD